MDTTTALHLPEADRSGFLRRAGRSVLGSAAILIVGAGAIPAADAAGAGVATGLKHISAQHSSQDAKLSPSALPAESRASAARFVVGEDGRLTRAD
ncbi:hypothetical protein [Flexivirga oryzae]|uniref:Uncharacterized protein n=1 Tax=Flexivirga oryzae TaxID=1794944 RepID=A0A839N6D8_9MICO|nr:hypothetical protein [Flexivirga oryzae]MBB2893310.1 hypothetical protein [Flexivirga oryzae]